MILPAVQSITVDGVAESPPAGDRPQEIVVSMMPASILRRAVHVGRFGEGAQRRSGARDALQVRSHRTCRPGFSGAFRMPPSASRSGGLGTSAGTEARASPGCSRTPGASRGGPAMSAARRSSRRWATTFVRLARRVDRSVPDAAGQEREVTARIVCVTPSGQAAPAKTRSFSRRSPLGIQVGGRAAEADEVVVDCGRCPGTPCANLLAISGRHMVPRVPISRAAFSIASACAKNSSIPSTSMASVATRDLGGLVLGGQSVGIALTDDQRAAAIGDVVALGPALKALDVAQGSVRPTAAADGPSPARG